MLPNEPAIAGGDAFEPGLRLEVGRLDSALPSDVGAGTGCGCPCCTLMWRPARLENTEGELTHFQTDNGWLAGALQCLPVMDNRNTVMQHWMRCIKAGRNVYLDE